MLVSVSVTLTSSAHERCSCRRAHPECVIRTERHAALDELVDGRRQRLVSVADAKVIVPSCPNACVRDKTCKCDRGVMIIQCSRFFMHLAACIACKACVAMVIACKACMAMVDVLACRLQMPRSLRCITMERGGAITNSSGRAMLLASRPAREGKWCQLSTQSTGHSLTPNHLPRSE